MTPQKSSSIGRVATLAVLVFGLATAACGGDDDGGSTAAATSLAIPSSVVTDQNGSVAGVGGVGGAIADAMGEEGAAQLDAAVDALGDDTMMNIVADQLGEGTTVVIDGSTVTFTIPSGSNEGGGPISDCLIIGAFADAASVVKVVYPDGETTC